ncbi:MAG: FliA/WhiG family RNA polymerase sigma factor [Phycisphaerales bacterium]|nr:FliA/WhiG family RNA polymerase sigma factor [Phycisphaerales bacterium]
MAATDTSTRSGTRNLGRHVARRAEQTSFGTPFDQRPLDEIWRLYRQSPTEDMRNYLVQRFLHLVRYNAERIYARLPDEVDIEDLMSAGLFGLMAAIDAYDPDREVKFETYSATRIRGAILDELRSMDWVPRLVRHRTAKVEQTRMRIQMETGAKPSLHDVASRLNLDPAEFEKYERDSKQVSMTSITRKCFPTDGSRDLREIDVIKDESQANPVSELQQRDLKDLITKGLSRAERLIVILYYYEGMTMKEIGATLDLSESRVSQMHSSILQRLKAQMQHRMRELEPVE